MTTVRARLALATWMTFVTAGVILAARLGRGVLAAPPVTAGWHGVSTWLGQRSADQALFAVVRVAVLLLGLYVLTTALAQVVAHAFRSTSLVWAVDRVTVPSIRRACQAAFGVSLLAGTVLVAGSGRSTASAQPQAALALGVAPGGPPALHRLDATDPPTMVRLDSDDSADATQPTMVRLPSDGLAADPHNTASGSMDPDAIPSTWTVAQGDSFWSIAEHVLRGAWARDPSDREIDPFWRSFVEVNRHALSDTRNPDLIFPGQELTIPTVPPLPAEH